MEKYNNFINSKKVNGNYFNRALNIAIQNYIKELDQQSQILNIQSLAHQSYQKKVYVGGGNNDALVKQYFSEKKDWSVLDKTQKFSTRFDFKWTQLYQDIDWKQFREGLQIVNHINNVFQVYGTKTGLLRTLKDFETKVQNKEIHSSMFFPETYILMLTDMHLSSDETKFLKTDNHSGLWIHKPADFNCGRGIQLISDIKSFKDNFLKLKPFAQQLMSDKHFKTDYFNYFNKVSVIQKYIENPLLLDNRKFDIRCYILIASAKPLLVLYHDGYIRLSLNAYKSSIEGSDSQFTHLTNNAVQKKHPNFEKLKENSIWSMRRFFDYLQKEYNRTPQQNEELQIKIKKILCYAIHCGADKIDKKSGCFELLGCDIMIDKNFKPYLIELNTNPAITLDTSTLKDVIPYVLHNALDIIMKVNENQDQKEIKIRNELIPYKTFTVLINETKHYSYL